jgi:phosphate transport system substrate-binding protein
MRELSVVGLAAYLAATSQTFALDPRLPVYQPVAGLSGSVRSVGSDTLNNEVKLWAKEFGALYPDVKIEIESKGSATAPPALLAGTSQFGPMSRPMSAQELDAFEKKYGYKVSSFRVAVDALAVYVNKDNPVPCFTLQQLNRIFSSTRKIAGGDDIKAWGDAGLTGDWATKEISLYGRNTLSGTYEFFREIALNGGDYKAGVKQEPGSEAVVEAVAKDRFAIGYSGLGYKSEGVRAVPLATYSGRTCYDTSADATYSGNYPIARYLYVYLNKPPAQPLEALRAEFIKYVLSKNGQRLTERGGFYPITNDIRQDELKKLGLSAATQ